MRQQPALIIINQTTNPAFNDWLNALVDEVGALEFWTGHPPDNLDGRIQVRTALPYDRTSNRQRLRTWLQFTLTIALWLLRVNHRIPVIANTNPPFLPLLVWLLHLVFRTPYGLIEWDIYPQIAYTMGILQENSLVYRMWYAWHQRALHHSKMIWTLGDNMAHELGAMLPDIDLPLYNIPHWVDTDWIQPMPRAENPFVQAHQLDKALVVLYSGNLGATHSIETIVALAENVRDEARIRFIIAGEGMKRPMLEAAVAAGRLPNLTLLHWQPAETIPQMFASADVAVVTLAVGYERYSVPSKTYGMLAAGNAILGISAAPNDLATTIHQHACGVNFATSEVEAMAAWLRELLENPQQLRLYQHHARTAATEYYAAQVCIPRLNQIVRETLLASDD